MKEAMKPSSSALISNLQFSFLLQQKTLPNLVSMDTRYTEVLDMGEEASFCWLVVTLTRYGLLFEVKFFHSPFFSSFFFFFNYYIYFFVHTGRFIYVPPHRNLAHRCYILYLHRLVDRQEQHRKQVHAHHSW